MRRADFEGNANAVQRFEMFETTTAIPAELTQHMCVKIGSAIENGTSLITNAHDSELASVEFWGLTFAFSGRNRFSRSEKLDSRLLLQAAIQ